MQETKVTIIVTSAGTASAISVIRGLKMQNEIKVHVVAVDLDPLAAGLFLADEFFIVPKADNQNYIPELIRIASNTGATVLIPIYSKEINLISENTELLLSHGIRTMLSTPDVIKLCNDKLAMNQFALEAGLNVPHLFSIDDVLNNQSIKFPVFVKPNSGSSSTGAQKIANKEELDVILKSNKNFIIQEFIDAEEVTVDVFCDINSNALVIAPRIRLAVKSGQCVKGKTMDKALFLEPITTFCKKLKVVGACNIQFFISSNKLSFIEINPRFAAGGLMLTIASGANIPLLLLKSLLGLEIEMQQCQTKPNISMTRYWSEIILDENNNIL